MTDQFKPGAGGGFGFGGCDMTCTCKLCQECKGSGFIWTPVDAEYPGSSRKDEWVLTEDCPVCGGDDLEDMCAECRDELLELLK